MRVTQQMLANSVSQNLRNNLNSLEKKSNQLSMGKQFDRPSQDPTGTYKVMGLTKIDLARNEQSQRNINEGISWMTATEDVLEESKEAVHRLRELAIYTASDSMTDEDREKAASEVKEIKEHLVGLANTEMRGLYLFGGHNTEEKPYQFTNDGNEGNNNNLEYKGDDGEREVEIAPGQEVKINITGEEAFGEIKNEGENGENSLFDTVEEMHKSLSIENEEYGKDNLDKIIGELDDHLDNLLQKRSELGARMERFYSTEDRLHDENINLKEMRSNVEDLDMAEAITEYNMLENAFQAALATGARMVQPSLVDFLN